MHNGKQSLAPKKQWKLSLKLPGKAVSPRENDVDMLINTWGVF